MQKAGLWIGLSLLCLAPGSIAQDAEAVNGMEAAVRGDWTQACLALAKSEDTRSSTRLSYARRRVDASLRKLLSTLKRKKMWRELAEAAACGLELDPESKRYLRAAALAAENGASRPPVDRRIRYWATRGVDFLPAYDCIQKCVAFLVSAQEKNGHWSSSKHGGGKLFDTGVTGLALLAILPHRPAASRRAAAALVETQHDDGVFGTRATHSFIYNHTIATLALAEYILEANKAKELGGKLQRAVDFLAEARAENGGWRYEPAGNEADTSVTAWAVSALRAAEHAGARVPASTFEGARAWATQMTSERNGFIGYNSRGGVAARPEGKQNTFPPEKTQAMTAAGCVVYAITGETPFAITKSMGRLDCILPQRAYADMYYWTLGARAYVRLNGDIPEHWSNALTEAVAALQKADGSIAPHGVWGPDGGTIYATAMCALALAAPYREPRSQHLSPRAFLDSKTRTVDVPAWAESVPTGIYVDSGTVLKIQASGQVRGYAKGPMTSADARKGDPRVKARTRGGALCLLGRIGDDKPFVVGIDKKVTMRGSGHLRLMVNDKNYADNAGAYKVTITLIR